MTQGGRPQSAVGVMLMVMHCGECPHCMLTSGGCAPFIAMYLAPAVELADGSIMINQDKEPEPVGTLVLN